MFPLDAEYAKTFLKKWDLRHVILDSNQQSVREYQGELALLCEWLDSQRLSGAAGLHFLIAKGDKFGAQAKADPDPYQPCVVTRYCTLTVLEDICSRLVSTVGAMRKFAGEWETSIAAPSLTVPSLFQSNIERGSLSIAGHAEDSAYPFLACSPAAERVKWALFRAAMAFVLNHEACHVVNGHLRLQWVPQVRSLGEDSAVRRSIRLALEMDADAYAVCRILRRCLPHVPIAPAIEKENLYLACFGLTMSLAFQRGCAADLGERTVATLLRELRVGGTMLDWVSKRRPGESEELRALIVQARIDVEHGLRCVFKNSLFDSVIGSAEAHAADEVQIPHRAYRLVYPYLCNTAHSRSELVLPKLEEELGPLEGTLAEFIAGG